MIDYRDIKFQFIIDFKHLSAVYTLEELLTMFDDDIVNNMEVCNCYLTESEPHCTGDCAKFNDSKITGRRQYSGLKDKNGVHIFEGDIVKGYQNGVDMNSSDYIVFERGKFNFKHTPAELSNCTHDLSEIQVEIIGNIFEHPHLFTTH